MFRTLTFRKLTFRKLTLGATLLLALAPLSAQAQTLTKPELTTLHTFNGAYGANPQSTLTLGTDGNLYGVTSSGGPKDQSNNGNGTIFKITPSGQFSTLHKFRFAEGATPRGSLVQGTDGAFYGTTFSGGSTRDGVAYKITTAGMFTLLHTFTGPEGRFPAAALLPAADGSFYGTTYQGGTFDFGTVFHMTADGTVTTLHSFPSYSPPKGADLHAGSLPIGRIVFGADGAIYGTTIFGGSHRKNFSVGDGTVYRITTGGAFSNVYEFNDGDGYEPEGGLAVGADGFLYGTVSRSYDNRVSADDPLYEGEVYKVSTAGVFVTLHRFIDDGHGANPLNGLTLGPDGNFYGMTTFGGTNSGGTVFQMTPAGGLTTLYKFHTAFDGAHPYAGVEFGGNGLLYGVTYEGGTTNYGTLFSLTVPAAN